jgi:hypothetical protein
MAFAVHQWWRGLIAGAAIKAAKNNQSAEAQRFFGSHRPPRSDHCTRPRGASATTTNVQALS